MILIDKLKKAKKTQPNNLFNYLTWNLLSAFMPLGVIIGCLSLFGVIPTSFNGKPIENGLFSFFLAIGITFFYSFLLGSIIWIFLKIGNFVLGIIIEILK